MSTARRSRRSNTAPPALSGERRKAPLLAYLSASDATHASRRARAKELNRIPGNTSRSADVGRIRSRSANKEQTYENRPNGRVLSMGPRGRPSIIPAERAQTRVSSRRASRRRRVSLKDLNSRVHATTARQAPPRSRHRCTCPTSRTGHTSECPWSTTRSRQPRA